MGMEPNADQSPGRNIYRILSNKPDNFGFIVKVALPQLNSTLCHLLSPKQVDLINPITPTRELQTSLSSQWLRVQAWIPADAWRSQELAAITAGDWL